MRKKKQAAGWEVSIMQFFNHIGRKYEVTRRLPQLSMAETKIFRSKKKAKKQFEDWLK